MAASKARSTQGRDRRGDVEAALQAADGVEETEAETVGQAGIGLPAHKARHAAGELQDGLRAHENFETRPVVEGADEPGIAVHPSGDTPGISPPLPGPQGAPATVGFDQEVGRAETGLQGEHDSGGKDGINETGGVTGEQDAPRGEGRKLPAVVAGGAQRSDASGGVQTLGDSGCGGASGPCFPDSNPRRLNLSSPQSQNAYETAPKSMTWFRGLVSKGIEQHLNLLRSDLRACPVQHLLEIPLSFHS